MPFVDQFVGGTYQAISSTFAADQCVNLYSETRRTDGSAKTRWLVGTPGLTYFASGSAGGCRGLFTQDGLTLAVIGATLYRIDIDLGSVTALGAIANDGEPVSFASNGKGGDEIAIVGGGQLKIYDLGTLTLSAAIVLPFSDPVMVAFIDGYFLINQQDTPIVWFSALEDGTTWDALDFFTRSGTSDNIIGIGVATSRVWAFGSKTTTLFYDSGDADTPFVPYPESVRQIGLVNPWAMTLRTDTFMWLATDQTGTPHVRRAIGDAQGVAISTPPIERFLAGCTTLTTARASTYYQDGHWFWCLSCPDSPDDIKTYAWDDTEQLWHARADWNDVDGTFAQWRISYTVTVGNVTLGGDASTPYLYILDLNVYANHGDILKRLRRTPYLSTDAAAWLFLFEAELICEVGVGLVAGQGSDPTADLALSRDAAKTWISAGAVGLGGMGQLGNYDARVIWRNLGRVRPDRLVFEVSMTDPVKCSWVGLRLRSEMGGQL